MSESKRARFFFQHGYYPDEEPRDEPIINLGSKEIVADDDDDEEDAQDDGETPIDVNESGEEEDEDLDAVIASIIANEAGGDIALMEGTSFDISMADGNKMKYMNSAAIGEMRAHLTFVRDLVHILCGINVYAL